MPSFLVRQSLSKDDLVLHLTNENGYSQDAFSVNWTVYSSTGTAVSGINLPAIKSTVGRYYAPWQTNVSNGAYRIVWSIKPESDFAPFTRTENFFVVDPSSYNCGGPLKPQAVPPQGSATFIAGTSLGPRDLPLYLKDDNGYLQSAYAVFWTILDMNKRPQSVRTIATPFGVGSYYAQWIVGGSSGNYTILWEFQQGASDPLQSASMPFSVIVPSAPITIYIQCPPILSFDNNRAPIIYASSFSASGGSGNCPVPGAAYFPPPSPPTFATPSCVGSGGSMNSFEIPRIIHLPFGLLPPSGNFTNQAVYNIPQAVRHLSFYVTYQRGAVGGQSALHLLWGNGVEESQEVVLGIPIITDPNSSQTSYFQEIDSPIPQNGIPITFILEINVPGGATTVRLIASEKGVTGTPGSLGVTLTGSTN